MNITKEQIESVKQANDIVSVVRAKGITLKKRGKTYKGLCPFHKEKTPSFTVDPVKQLYHCFGCSNTGKGSTGGDVIGFVVKYDKITFQQAIEQLSGQKTVTRVVGAVEMKRQVSGVRDQGVGKSQTTEGRGQTTEKAEKQEAGKRQTTEGRGQTTEKAEKQEPEESPSAPQPAKHQKLLKRVVEFYHKTFTQDDKGFKYLTETRKITDKNIFTSFNVGYSNGTLLKALPDDGDIIESLKEIGILNQKGNELFYGSVIFPIYDQHGNITTIYGRKAGVRDQGSGVSKSNGKIKHLYLPGSRKGFFNWQTVKTNEEIIVTESIIDSLTLYNAGFKNTIPCYGTNGLTDDHVELFRKYGVKTIYLCLNGDTPGRKAVECMTPKLTEIAAVYPVTLPDNHDINSFFSLVDNGVEAFKVIMIKANPALAQTLNISPEEEKADYRKTTQGFTVTYGGREYEVIGISKGSTKLKATIKGIRTDKGQRRFHIDTVDFYSSKSRSLLTGGLSDLFGESEGIITNDLNRILELIDKLVTTAKAENSDTKEIVITQPEREEALRFLKNPNMFEEIIKDFETAGYVGDNIIKLLCYIACISRKLEKPISIMIQSRSAAGKSFLQDTVLSFMPKEDFSKYTRLTDQSLFYKEKDSLKNKILAIEELDGINGAVYSIRTLQSSGEITIAYTGKESLTGTMRTAENTVNGPVMMFVTTTAVDIDSETASRFMFSPLDETAIKTAAILEKQRKKHTLEGLYNKLDMEKITKKHQTANRLLKPVTIINPYASLLTFTSQTIRVHREHDKYLFLIDAIAYLFQYQREIRKTTYKGRDIEYILVKISDIEKAHEIAHEVLGDSLNELSTPSGKLLQLIKEMVREICKQKNITPKEYHFTRRQIREYTGWSDFQVKTHIKELEDMEYLYSVTGKKGKEYVYELIYTGGGEDGSRFLIGLISIEELREKAKKAGLPVD